MHEYLKERLRIAMEELENGSPLKDYLDHEEIEAILRYTLSTLEENKND